ncbi:hypothetical protein [Vibrio ziniensis]|uniref:Lipoprotein SmpA/OmlA domain-containing protein n=1 Tax=Vibrio ziniensis TaxID=2711221 RepID=A0A6G7CLH3_9VIBR|nr:hypothetical protein [Vibrio ziniensis]QIH42952.1 hypothetical protein G5S32_13785 [Vibrio ziniensis]
MNKKLVLQVLGLALTASITAGCASNSASSSAQSSEAAVTNTQVAGNIPAKSKFAKVKVGMTMGEVNSLIGNPTDSTTYITGKSFIPFYFGNDAARIEALYKGEGRIIYTGGNAFGRKYRVYKIAYNPSEPGFTK